MCVHQCLKLRQVNVTLLKHVVVLRLLFARPRGVLLMFIRWINHHFNHLHFIISLETNKISTHAEMIVKPVHEVCARTVPFSRLVLLSSLSPDAGSPSTHLHAPVGAYAWPPWRCIYHVHRTGCLRCVSCLRFPWGWFLFKWNPLNNICCIALRYSVCFK